MDLTKLSNSEFKQLQKDVDNETERRKVSSLERNIIKTVEENGFSVKIPTRIREIVGLRRYLWRIPVIIGDDMEILDYKDKNDRLMKLFDDFLPNPWRLSLSDEKVILEVWFKPFSGEEIEGKGINLPSGNTRVFLKQNGGFYHFEKESESKITPAELMNKWNSREFFEVDREKWKWIGTFSSEEHIVKLRDVLPTNS